MSTKSLVKSTGIIGTGTAVSRILGFVRDMLIARFFGTTASIEAFFVALRIPNLLRDITAEGAMNSAVVPVLSEYVAAGKEDEYRRVVNILIGVILIALTAVLAIGVIIAPLIVRVIAPGFASDAGLISLTVKLTRILFPFILFIGLAAYAMGVLNSLKHFTMPAFAPALLNIAVIAAILIFNRGINVMILSIAFLAGGALEFLIQLPVLYKKGVRLGLPDTLRHPAVNKIGRLLLPRVLGSAVYQLNVFIDTILASLYWIVGTGGIAALWFSSRIIQLPTAVFSVSLATAALPTISRYFAEKDMESFKKTINFSLRMTFLVMIPAAAGIMILGDDIVRTLFQGGKFTAYSTMITNSALFFYALSLPSYGCVKILAFSFYSMHDTVTPVKAAAAALAVNTALNLALMFPLKVGGLALATSIAALFNFLTLFYALRKRIGGLGERYLAIFLGKALLAALFMGGVLYMGLGRFNAVLEGRGFIFGVLGLLLYVAGGMIIYFTALYALRVKELGRFARWILRIE